MSLAQEGTPLPPVSKAATVRTYARTKRILDILIIAIALPICLPLIGILAVAVWCDGSNPFYRQIRVGKDGELFTMWKLRTMVRDADKALLEYLAKNANAAREWHESQKLKSDPRVTWIGAHIRRYSLDELPQLWNVLRGDMSLVGPRPMLPEQRRLYPGQAYFTLRPGLTGLWQVGTRNRSSFADRAIYDTRYAQAMSLPADLKILLLTVVVVVRGTGV
jgi:exopolysaccharide production protein ExoY